MSYLIIFLYSFLHPYHVSVADIVYNDEADALQVSYRMFLDDLELALREESGNEELNIVKDSAQVRRAIESYFRKNFQLKVNGTAATYNYLGSEIEDDGMWTYLEVTGVKEVQDIELVNKLLLDIYDDQQNIIHFKVDGDKKSFIMNQGETRVVYPR